MATGVVSWSQTASSNDVADSNVNWAEGQAPSSVNDSARAMMSSVAKWRDDICGIILTAGTSTAYTITSNQVQASNLNGMTVQFLPHVTNGATVTLSVDGQTARPLRFYTGVELPAGVLVSGSLYQATYRSASTEWLLHSFDTSLYSIPIGGSIVYWGAAAPNGSFALPQGQAISRTTYATLFSLVGTTYGPGNGSTTFNLPDLVGRVPAMLDAGSARLSSTYFGGNPASLGASGGLEYNTLVTANLPAYTPAGNLSIGAPTANFYGVPFGQLPQAVQSAGASSVFVSSQFSAITLSSGGGSFSGTAQGGTSTPFRTVQPTVISNHIIRII